MKERVGRDKCIRSESNKITPDLSTKEEKEEMDIWNYDVVSFNFNRLTGPQ